ncbi:MAG: peptide transporter [Planctomycetota bacterium]|nr:peptide transporter [Planctomycetota bacterium]
MAKEKVLDTELEMYRNLLVEPTEFKDGFGWATVVGIFFCGLIMMPGSIYLGLMTGGSMGSAATWVTVILFSEVMRRAMKSMSKQELVVLLYAAGAMAGGGIFGDFVMRAYLVQSDAIRDAGLRDAFPTWYVPKPGSAALTGRNLFHHEWLVPIALAVIMSVIGLINKWTLGYFFFRLTSDVEQLPFPLAPISAQGAMALAEEDGAEDPANEKDVLHRKPGEKKKSDRWRLFSLGSTLGIAFGFIQIGVPAISGLFLDKPFYLIPTPWIDTTTLTESIMPATPTGLIFDLGLILIGMVIPFWAVIGAVAAVVLTIVLNPILHHFGTLQRWQPGMDTVNTTFANSVDFWMSFTTGVGLGVAVVSIYQTIRDVRKKVVELRKERAEKKGTPDPARKDIWAPPKPGRGDYPIPIALGLYAFTSVGLVLLCYKLLPHNSLLLAFLFFFAFVYNPLISYVNARLLGIAGQTVDIPFVKELAFIMSGSKGVEIWLAPIPIANYGGQAQSFRINELTGVKFWSLLKLDLIVTPVSFVLSMLFWAFIWASAPIPSSSFPTAQKFWELSAKQTALLFSSTFVAPGSTTGGSITDSQFWQAVHPTVIATGFGATVVAFILLSAFGLPVLLIYGVIRGLGGWPHGIVLELVGALIGRYYFQKKFGPEGFLRMIPTVLAGYYTGVGLIAMATIAMNLIQAAVSSAPF